MERIHYTRVMLEEHYYEATMEKQDIRKFIRYLKKHHLTVEQALTEGYFFRKEYDDEHEKILKKEVNTIKIGGKFYSAHKMTADDLEALLCINAYKKKEED